MNERKKYSIQCLILWYKCLDADTTRSFPLYSGFVCSTPISKNFSNKNQPSSVKVSPLMVQLNSLAANFFQLFIIFFLSSFLEFKVSEKISRNWLSERKTIYHEQQKQFKFSHKYTRDSQNCHKAIHLTSSLYQRSSKVITGYQSS